MAAGGTNGSVIVMRTAWAVDIRSASLQSRAQSGRPKKSLNLTSFYWILSRINRPPPPTMNLRIGRTEVHTQRKRPPHARNENDAFMASAAAIKKLHDTKSLSEYFVLISPYKLAGIDKSSDFWG